MKDRLSTLMREYNLTALKFAEIMEVRPSNISHIISGRNNPGFDFIARLLKRFTEINPDWLINGEGEMFRDADTEVYSSNSVVVVNDAKPEIARPVVIETPSGSTNLFEEPVVHTNVNTQAVTPGNITVSRRSEVSIAPIDQPVADVDESEQLTDSVFEEIIPNETKQQPNSTQSEVITNVNRALSQSTCDNSSSNEEFHGDKSIDVKPLNKDLAIASALASAMNSTSRIKQIIVFYEDDTFDVYNSRSKK